jgi:hypothetical protein
MMRKRRLDALFPAQGPENREPSGAQAADCPTAGG